MKTAYEVRTSIEAKEKQRVDALLAPYKKIVEAAFEDDPESVTFRDEFPKDDEIRSLLDRWLRDRGYKVQQRGWNFKVIVPRTFPAEHMIPCW